MKPRGLCRWIGHNIDAESHVYMGITYCVRCGDDDGVTNGDYEPAWIERLRWHYWMAFKAKAGSRWRGVREWWCCPMCRGRFGRHDPDGCLPF